MAAWMILRRLLGSIAKLFTDGIHLQHTDEVQGGHYPLLRPRYQSRPVPAGFVLGRECRSGRLLRDQLASRRHRSMAANWQV
jgi:hypothetical protein